jgi:hypothetical protein
MKIPKKLLKIIISFMLVVTFTCLGLYVYLELDYMHSMPRAPQSELNRIYPLNIHGTVVYITKEQDSLLNWLFWMTGIFGLGAGVLNVAFRVFSDQRAQIGPE